MQYPSLAQLAKMPPAHRVQRLRGADPVTLAKLVAEAAVLVHDIVEVQLVQNDQGH